jgi:LacI family transcriptional regulator
VSHVFNRRPHIRPGTRERVLEAARKLSYEPRPRPNTEKPNVALLLPGQGDVASIGSYETRLIMAISQQLSRLGFLFEAIPAGEADLLSKDWFQGAIALFSSDDVHAKIQPLYERMPVLTINRPGAPGHTVYSDDDTALGDAVKLLADRGHRRIGLFGRPFAQSRSAQRRLHGYLQALAACGLERDDRLIKDCARSSLPWIDVIEPLIEADPSALIVLGEDMALPVMHALWALGKRVPDDMSVISYESPTVSCVMTPPHTTIAQDMERIAEEAVRGMEQLVRGGRAEPYRVSVPCTIVERESVRDLTQG